VKYLLLAIVVVSSGCATIVSKSKYPFHISSSPDSANVVIIDRKGDTVTTGITPMSLKLKAGKGYMRKAKYVITFSKDSFVTGGLSLKAEYDHWYSWNMVFGGLIGWLIVDPITGAMWKFHQSMLYKNLFPREEEFWLPDVKEDE